MTKTSHIASDLPEGWAPARLADGLVVDVQPGFACGNNNRDGDGIGHVRPMNVSREGRLAFSDLKYVPASEADCDERLLRMGDVVFNNTNSPDLVGKTAYYDHSAPLAFSNHMTRIRCRADVLEPRYCANVLHQFWRTGYFKTICNNHISQSSVSQDVIGETEIPLAPVAEQKRIVCAIETLLSQVESIKTRLSRIPAILKRFREAVLASACSGKLTKSWRETQSTAELSSVLLENTLAERRDGWVRTKFRPPSDMNFGDLPDIPESWCWASFDSFVTESFYGPKFGADEYAQEGVPTIRTTDISFDGSVRLNDPPRLRLRERLLHELCLQHEDLLVTRTGATIGKCALYDEAIGPAIPSAYIIRFRLTRRTFPPKYLLLFLMSPMGQRLLVGGSTAVAQPNVNAKNIGRFPVPLPPRTEIAEIIRRVELLLGIADTFEKQVVVATRRAEKLGQSILAKAFRGELVPTEAEFARRERREYEPASALLERIKQQRQAEPVQKPERRLRERKAKAASAKRASASQR